MLGQTTTIRPGQIPFEPRSLPDLYDLQTFRFLFPEVLRTHRAREAAYDLVHSVCRCL